MQFVRLLPIVGLGGREQHVVIHAVANQQKHVLFKLADGSVLIFLQLQLDVSKANGRLDDHVIVFVFARHRIHK